jgi:hypothetical protein
MVNIASIINNIDSNLIIILSFLSFFIIGMFVSILLRSVYKSSTLKRRFKRGEDGENLAISILKENGFYIIKPQPEGHVYMWINGIMKKLNIRADFLVSKNGSTYICEVKTGRTAGDVTYKHTRRQILEYYLYFQLPVVFVDVLNRRVCRIDFALPD